MIYLYTGEGPGKTTNALGLALRSVAHKRRVVIIQFMKGRKDIGEYIIKDKLKPYYEIYQFGRKEFVNLKNPSEEDKKLAKKGLEFTKEIIEKGNYDLLILDEINLACAAKLINTDKVVNLLKKVPKEKDVVLTGRYAPSKLINIADFVNLVNLVKMPEKLEYKKGIQY